MSVRPGPAAARQESESAFQLAHDLIGRHQAGTSGGELYSKRDTIQPPTEVGNRWSVMRADLEARRSKLGTIRKQDDRLALGEFLKIYRNILSGDRQRNQAPDCLAADTEGLTAGGKYGDSGTGAKDPVYQIGAIIEHVLTVVDHQ